MGHNDDAAVTIAEIRTIMPLVTPATVYMWAQRGKVRRLGKRNGRTLFRWGDVVAAERETSLKSWSTRHEAELAA